MARVLIAIVSGRAGKAFFCEKARQQGDRDIDVTITHARDLTRRVCESQLLCPECAASQPWCSGADILLDGNIHVASNAGVNQLTPGNRSTDEGGDPNPCGSVGISRDLGFGRK